MKKNIFSLLSTVIFLVISFSVATYAIYAENAPGSAKPAVILEDSSSGTLSQANLTVRVLRLNKETARVESILSSAGKLPSPKSVYAVYDVSLSSLSEEVRPDETVRLKLAVPAELAGKEFNLYHIRNGEEITDAENVTPDENGYVVFETNNPSQFVFVANASRYLFFLWVIIGLVACGTVVWLFADGKRRKIEEN